MGDHYGRQLAALIAGTLDPTSFTHRDHVGIAVEALRQHDFFDALHIVAGGLRDMTKRAGVPDKFHATLTLAHMSVIAERLALGAYVSTEAFLDSNGDLLHATTVRNLYAAERLSQPAARSVGLLP